MIGKILGWFFGNATGGNAIGNAVVNVGTIAALTPLALWFLANKNEVAYVVHYDDLAIIGLLFAGMLKLAQHVRLGSAADRGQ